jgi:hypothetical protein
MSRRPPHPPSGRAERPGDDFDWPPAGDDPGIYVVTLDADEDEPPPGVWRRRAALAADPDPWRGLQEAATEVFAQRHGAPRPPQPARAGYASRRESLQRLGLLLASAAVVVAAASWTLYRITSVTTPDALAQAEKTTTVVATAADPPAPVPSYVTIVATYPVDDRRAANDRTGADALPFVATPAEAIEPAPDATLAALAPEPGLFVDATAPLPDAPAAAADAGPSLSPIPVAAVIPPEASRAAPARDERIRHLLDQYEAAYDRRDVRTAAALVPSHDVRALSRAFDGLDRQDVSFDRCDIDAGDDRGSAVCVGRVRYVPRVGRSVEREGRITWTFHLTRLGDDWRIDRFSAR